MSTNLNFIKKFLMEIRLYGFILCVMTVTYFVGTAFIFKEELKNVTCNTTSIDKSDEITMITEYLNKTIPN